MRFSRKQKRIDEAAKIVLDPVLCAVNLLKVRLWAKQQEILLSVANHRKTAVKACHASGKTFVAAIVALWWLITHENGIVITTAPTWMQVERVLWGEIHSAVNRAAYGFPRPSATKLEMGPNRYLIGIATDEGVRFQGFHGDVLVIIDEAPGVRPEIYEAIAGIEAGGDVRILALGNPVIASGNFYDVFTENRESWSLLTISAFDTPNLQGLNPESLLKLPDYELNVNPYPSLTTRVWVKEKYREWGPGHPLWESRVLGNFPTQSDDALFSLTWLEQAKLRTEGDGDVYAGIDVAGPGEDETVLCVHQGPKIILLRAWTGNAQGNVIAALRPFKASLKSVNIDSAGIGYYFAKNLAAEGFSVNEINVGQRPKDSERFANRKAEVYWYFRTLLESGNVAGLTDERAIAQLLSIRYSHNSRGQIVIESKDDARKRGVKSPDRAEALILAFADLTTRYALLEYWQEQYGALAGPISGAVEQPTACPSCGATCIARIPSEWICNKCGQQFGRTFQPLRGPTRGEALNLWDSGRRW